ncbi:hypothetical protein VTG60DRAFT_2736 [Thermothelomyces hinnuleus]
MTPSSLRAHFPSRQPSAQPPPPPPFFGRVHLSPCWGVGARRKSDSSVQPNPETKRPKRANKWRRDRGKKENTTKNNRNATRRVRNLLRPAIPRLEGNSQLVPNHDVALSPPHLPLFPHHPDSEGLFLGYLPPTCGGLRGTEGGIGDTGGFGGRQNPGKRPGKEVGCVEKGTGWSVSRGVGAVHRYLQVV